MDADERLKQKFSVLFLYLDERQRRIAAATEAKSLGRGGVSVVARASGMSRPSIYKGLVELKQRKPGVPLGRSRKKGAGRKSARERDPKIVEESNRLVDPDTRGDPMSPLRWTCKSTRQLAKVLTESGHAVSHRVVSELLAKMGYSLQSNRRRGPTTPTGMLSSVTSMSRCVGFRRRDCRSAAWIPRRRNGSANTVMVAWNGNSRENRRK